ncbi:MAG: erythromycin esterase family protein [Aequorivita sp.]
MRNIKPYLVCLVILASHSIILAQSKYNLNFDDFNSEKQAMPDGWFKWGNFKNITGEKSGADNYVGKVISDSKGKFGCITYMIPANYVGDTIRLSGRIKFENVKDYVGLMMRIDGGSDGGFLALEDGSHLKIRGTNDWKEYAIKLPYPSGAESIYVGGILSGGGTAWFDDFKVEIDGKDIQTLKETPKITLESYDSTKLYSAISNSSRPINFETSNTLSASLDPLIAELGDKKIVAIGESTHGTSEFYKLREAITKRLIQEEGFNMVILESPYDNIELLNKDLETKPLDNLIMKHLFSIYQTQEMKSFLQWYQNNRSKYNISFKGCDDSNWVFYEVLADKLVGIKDSELDKLMKKLKSNITKGSKSNSKNELSLGINIYNNLVTIEKYLKSTNNLTKPVEEIIFNGKNTYINYVNIKSKKQFQSRDEIMAERISYLAKDKNNKIIVWAHNAHISNEIIVDKEIGIMGRDLKQEFGDDYHSIGLTTLKGSYSFIDEKSINGDPVFTNKLKKGSIESTDTLLWENVLAQNGDSFYLNLSALKEELNTDDVLGPIKFIGYNKETNKDIYKLPLFKDFDSLIFIENTNATTPLFN